MSYDERKLCVVCAWRGTCNLKYSMPGGVALHCTEFTRDVTLKEPEEEIRQRNVLLIGPREIGKTTLVQHTVERAGLPADGYYARTVKEGLFGGRRQEVVFMSGGVHTIATTTPHRNWYRLGKFYVNLEVIEHELVPHLRRILQSDQVRLVVMDEVNLWLCLSEAFRNLVVDSITASKHILTSVNVGEEDDAFVRALESRSDVTVFHLTYENRDILGDRILFMLTGRVAPPAAMPKREAADRPLRPTPEPD